MLARVLGHLLMLTILLCNYFVPLPSWAKAKPKPQPEVPACISDKKFGKWEADAAETPSGTSLSYSGSVDEKGDGSREPLFVGYTWLGEDKPYFTVSFHSTARPSPPEYDVAVVDSTGTKNEKLEPTQVTKGEKDYEVILQVHRNEAGFKLNVSDGGQHLFSLALDKDGFDQAVAFAEQEEKRLAEDEKAGKCESVAF